MNQLERKTRRVFEFAQQRRDFHKIGTGPAMIRILSFLAVHAYSSFKLLHLA
jgi:hypothetical protein